MTMPEIPEIPAMTILQRQQSQKTQSQNEASTRPAETDKPQTPVAPKRGRPLGSKNKTTIAKDDQTPKPPPKDTKALTARNNKKDTPDPPDFTEWQGFLGEVVLHWFSVAFISVAFRGIPYHDILSQEDYEDIQLDDDELSAVARPFAHVLTHSKLNTKYGRAIMNSRDSIEAMVIMFMWGARVKRISNKYRSALSEVSENVSRIPRPDRARDSNTEIDPEEIQPIVGAIRSAFGHGFN